MTAWPLALAPIFQPPTVSPDIPAWRSAVGGVEHFNPDNSEDPYGVVFMNTATGQGCVVPNQWYWFDLTPYGVPLTAIEATLVGRLIITDPVPGIANITATFRTRGSSYDIGNYQCQADSASSDGESTARTNMEISVPLTNGQFEMAWQCPYPAAVPMDGVHNASYGIDLSLLSWQ